MSMATTVNSSPRDAGLIPRIKGVFERHEKYTGIAVFGAGFIWDSLTLTRVDNVIDNLFLLFYLALIAALIVFTLRRQCGKAPAACLQKLEPRFLWAMQFCFGGLFSSYVIFYFKSASFTRTQFFFLVLVVLWIGNEFLEQRLGNPTLLAGLYCFCLFSFLAFFLPVIFAKVSVWIFLFAGIVSMAASLALFALALRADSGEWRRRMTPVAGCIASIFVGLNILYFANLIPPVPLALKSAGIYHHVTRTPAGYQVEYVPPPLTRFWRQWDNPFYFSPGESIYCYTAVFAPGQVRVPVRHVWSRKSRSEWVQTDRIGFEIAGGREGGYRGYTSKNGVTPGDWRVEVETERGQILGRIDFKVVPGPDPHPALSTRLIR